jgi:hypothetical protein
MAISKLPTGAILDNSITNAKIADDAIGVADLAATGTPSTTTFLRGDNAWATPIGGVTSVNGVTGAITAAHIATAVEAASGSNTFTDADHTKLSNIEGSATADQTNSEIKTAVEAATSIALGGSPTTTTQAESDNTTKLATTAYVTSKITTLIGGAPSTLNDLNELALAINDDANYNSTLTTALGTKMPKAGGAFTGAVTTNSTFDGVDIATRDGVLTSTTATAAAALPKAGGTLTGVLKGVAGSVSAPSFAFSNNLNTGLGFVTNKGLFGTAMGLKVFQVEKINNNPHFAIGRDSNFSDNSNVMSLELGGSASLTSNVAVGEFSGVVLQTNSRYTDSGDLAIATGRVTRAAQYYGAQWFDYASASAGAGITWKRSLTLDYGGAVTLYHNNAVKIATTVAGVTVSGNVTTSGVYNDGDLILESNSNIYLKRNTGGGATMLKAVIDGTVELYHDNTKKFETSAAGVTITGTPNSTVMPTLGGVAIAAKGSNSNGKYTKFADGTMICEVTKTTTEQNNGATAGGYYVSDSYSWTYPVAFHSVPRVVANQRGAHNNAVAGKTFGESTSATNFRTISVNSTGNSQEISLLAYGWWTA